ncbi:MAG: AAA family ATPase [Candidatus Omnitrophica bacterium]|nr:AAA family ATPase [Candidatus Omnitrophota bacterium]MCM8810645.1 AAA family ATPase [Candidatus Omnitrophota bacterium]
MSNKVKIEDFYRLWTSEIDKLLSGYIYDETGELNPTRYIFSYYLSILEKFTDNRLEEIEKINLLSGIRGVGKTTLLAQLYYAPKFISSYRKTNCGNIVSQNYEKIYLDVSRLAAEGISLTEFFNYYQEINNIRFVDLDKKLLILLDEVHYDEKWGLFLKNIFDTTKNHKNILVIATGSSALRIKLNPDLSRRSLLEELYPLKFNEYVILKHNIFPQRGLSDNLIEAVLKSKNAKELFAFYINKQNEISRYFSKLPPDAEKDYLYFGGFPFVLRLKNKKSIVFELVSGVIDKLITKDLLEMKKFRSETIFKIKDLLYLIASSDSTDIDKLCNTLKLDYRTVRGVLDALVQSGVLVEIRSYGQKFVRVRKPIKFLFISPSLRISILNGILPPEVKGKILEDYLALIFKKDFQKKEKKHGGIEIMHDSSSGGADFILRIGREKKIIIEIGFGKENDGIRQIENTGRTIGGYDYGIVIGQRTNLELVRDKIIKMPFNFWLVM